ncbi:hypothetical protein [Pedobacter hiemivivus]|uniref:Uncharacterized protein n=1 Tax=Pedobacter hiemivivus TaxID=2530454 RepID=A0A4V2MKV2_9SPHI|nr:hypothetical protein [Pedobacter hiemivivus]TCC99566.1 hypothetical protein EZ444_02505 [Pedobacter hiemivivus]
MKKYFFPALVAIAAFGGALKVNAQYSGYLADGTPRNCTFSLGHPCDFLVFYDSPIEPRNQINPSIYEDFFYQITP